MLSARFWQQHWLAVRTMPQDLIGGWSQRKPHMAEALKNLREWSIVSRQKDFAEHSDGCWYLHRNVSVLQSWIPLQVVDRKQGVFWFANKRVQITKLSILKIGFTWKFSREWGTQAKAQCKRNLNCQLWRKVGGRPCLPKCYLQSEMKVEPYLRLVGL